MIATLQMWALLEFCLQTQDMYDYILTTWHLLSDIIPSQLFIRNNAKELKLVHLWPDTDTKINSSMEVVMGLPLLLLFVVSCFLAGDANGKLTFICTYVRT